MQTTQDSQTYPLSGHRTRFCPTNVDPSHSSRAIPRVAVPAQIQQRNRSTLAHSACAIKPMAACNRCVGLLT